MRRSNRVAIVVVLASVIPLRAAVAGRLAPGPDCESKADAALRSCMHAVAKAQLTCFQQTGAACLPGDTKIARSLQRAQDSIVAKCPDASTLVAAGYPPALTQAGLVARVEEACQSAPMSLVARAFGGPRGAVRATAAAGDVTCLDTAYDQARKFLEYALRAQNKCVVDAHAGKTCDPAKVATQIGARQARTVTKIAGLCPDLPGLVAVDPIAFVARAGDQVDCMTAAAHSQTAPLALACGPRASVPVPPLATNTQVVLDSATWGTRCGDGSDFAFWLRLAPAGQPVGRVVVFMAGGGSCIDGPSCAATSPDLFEALSDGMTMTGPMSDTNVDSAFKDWTKVFIPYCTQDGHTGGGVVNAFPEMTVYRYGALNVRAAMRYVRDVLWASMDASDPDGFRPDRLLVLFSGSSAGGDGVEFNYHYLLDDLRWVHTTALPDSALGLDNGMGAAMARGTLALSTTTPGWGALPMAPPYCHVPDCGAFWNTMALAHSARLKMEPEQQMLFVSNQVDSTQKATCQFPNMGSFVNTLRARYCEQGGATGLHSFLSASSTSEHGNINENSLYNGLAIGGTLMRDWLGGAMSAPDAVIDEIATGTIDQDINGAQPFPCAVGSPSGAFVEG